jgi:hypothetical protein
VRLQDHAWSWKLPSKADRLTIPPSRSDAYYGNVLVFNQSVFDETKSYFTSETVTLEMAAKARLARIKTSKATNPTYTMSDLGDAFTYGESAAYVVVLGGDKKSATVKRSWVEWLFGEFAFSCFDQKGKPGP